MRARLLLWLSSVASIAYLLTLRWQPFPASALLKGIPVGALAVFALGFRGVRRDAGVLALGLAFSTAGDVLLDLGPRFFVFGLAAFLGTHLTYICLFVRNRVAGVRLDPPLLAVLLLVLAYSGTLAAWIVPSVGDLAAPVVLYVCALWAMVSTAILARFKQRMLAIGAILFLISDSLLAINRFKTPLPLAGYLVWITYYLGQCGIALGYLQIPSPYALPSSTA